jgi:2,4-dienoyl-CoA reductase (NADPH2)
MYDLLFSPGKINKLELKNRLLMLPMHLCFTKDHEVGERDIEFYRKRAAGGAAAITLSTAISPRGTLYHMHFIESDERIPGLKKLADVIHENDCKFFVQLFHCGRCGNENTLDGLHPIAPSAVASRIYKEVPLVMTKEDILEVQDSLQRLQSVR